MKRTVLLCALALLTACADKYTRVIAPVPTPNPVVPTVTPTPDPTPVPAPPPPTVQPRLVYMGNINANTLVYFSFYDPQGIFEQEGDLTVQQMRSILTFNATNNQVQASWRQTNSHCQASANTSTFSGYYDPSISEDKSTVKGRVFTFLGKYPVTGPLNLQYRDQGILLGPFACTP